MVGWAVVKEAVDSEVPVLLSEVDDAVVSDGPLVCQVVAEVVPKPAVVLAVASEVAVDTVLASEVRMDWVVTVDSWEVSVASELDEVVCARLVVSAEVSDVVGETCVLEDAVLSLVAVVLSNEAVLCNVALVGPSLVAVVASGLEAEVD